MKKIKSVILKNKISITAYLAVGLLSSFFSILGVNYLKKVLDGFTNRSLTSHILIVYGLLLVGVCILEYLDEYPSNQLSESIYYDFKLMAMEKLQKIDYLSFQKYGTGNLIQRIENGARAGKNIIYDFYLHLIRSLIPNLVFSLIFIVSINKSIVVYLLLGYVVVFVVSNVLLRYLYHIKGKILNNEELFNKYLVRSFMEFLVFRVHKQLPGEIGKASKARQGIIQSKTKMKLIHEAFFAIFELLVIVIKLLVLFISWQSELYTVGSIVALLTLIDKAYSPIAIFNVLYVQYKLDQNAYLRFKEFLNEPEDFALENGIKVEDITGKIKVKDLCFTYDNKKVFDQLSLAITAGSKVSLIGESGSGKSTLIKLIMGLIKPNGGQLFVDDFSLTDIHLNNYLDHVSYTCQESPIFHGSLRENIVFDKCVPDDDIIEVLKLVGLQDFYQSLSKGLETELGERGIKISGGERQRVALARLYFTKASIVILDEATSALDNLTEDYVMSNLMKQLADKTVIIIAHRLRNIEAMDEVIVMKSGKIVGRGDYESLQDDNQYFKDLIHKSIS